MKKIYFVRHGQSEGNIGPIRQTSATPLTAKGKIQAGIVAKRCAKLPIEVIICSSMARAKQTADRILKESTRPIEYSELVVERRRASEVLGRPKDDPIAQKIENEIRENFYKTGWHFSDEENFDDIKDRALATLQYLKERTENNILVVTHGLFLRVIVACVIFGEELTGKEGEQFMRALDMENTGITVLEYDEEKKWPWGLWIWNDHAHLD